MKFLAMLSGGIDSSVAIYLMKKKNYNVEAVHFEVNGMAKVEELAKKLKVKLHVINHAPFLKKVKSKCDAHLTCILCKRRMLTESAGLSKSLGADAVLTGDNLAQVASQTMENMLAEQALIDLPIVRPLIGLNKQEIIAIAKKAGTYELSVRDAGKCPFVPSKPATRASAERVNQEWSKLR